MQQKQSVNFAKCCRKNLCSPSYVYIRKIQNVFWNTCLLVSKNHFIFFHIVLDENKHLILRIKH